MSNVDIVKTAYDGFASGDIPAVIGVLDESIEWSAPMTLPQGGEFTGPAGVIKFFEGIGGAWEGLSLEIEALGAVSDDTVVAIVKGTGTLSSGTPSGYGATHVFTLQSGKVIRFREYTDLGGPLAG